MQPPGTVGRHTPPGIITPPELTAMVLQELADGRARPD
jgi:hypothetical protein